MAKNNKAASVNPQAPEVKKQKKSVIIVAAILAVAAVAGIVFGIWYATRDKSFNFMKDDISKYITISEEDYKNYDLSDVPIEEVTDLGITREINKLLVSNKNMEALDGGAAYRSVAVTLGDVVTIWYRGYTVDENGKETDFAGGTSLTGEGTTLEIGSGSFIPGFEESLVGVIPNNYTSLNDIKQTKGNVQYGDIIYLTYKVMKSDGSTDSKSGVRIDLGDGNVDSVYGTGFIDYFIGKESDEGVTAPQQIGEDIPAAKFFIGKSTISTLYYDMKVEYVLRETEEPLNIDVRFPADYQQTNLRGVNAKFDVYVQNAVIYDTPEYNDAFITETLKMSAESLEKYEGATLTEKHTAYIREMYAETVKQINLVVREEAMWSHYKSVVVINEMPADVVQSYYDSYCQQLEAAYKNYESTYDSIDSFAIDYYGLNQGVDWRDYVNAMANDVTLEKLIFYYIMRDADLFPSDEVYEERYNRIYNEYLRYYIDLNAETLSKYQGAAYDAEIEKIKEEMMSYYGEEYFKETVYYDYGTEKMIEFGLKNN